MGRFARWLLAAVAACTSYVLPADAPAQSVAIVATGTDSGQLVQCEYRTASGSRNSYRSDCVWEVAGSTAFRVEPSRRLLYNREAFLRPVGQGCDVLRVSLRRRTAPQHLSATETFCAESRLTLRRGPPTPQPPPSPPPPVGALALTFPNSGGSPLTVGDIVDLRAVPPAGANVPSTAYLWSASGTGITLAPHHRSSAQGELVALIANSPGTYTVTVTLGAFTGSTAVVVLPRPAPAPDPLPDPAPAPVPLPSGSVEPVNPVGSARHTFDALTPAGWNAQHWGLLSTAGGVLQMKFAQGTTPADQSFGPGWIWHPGLASKTVYMRVRLKLSDNFHGNPSGQQKLFEWFLTDPGGRVLLSVENGGGLTDFRPIAYGRDDARLSMNRANPVFTRGDWHTLDAVASLNSAPGRADGIFAYSLDGQLLAYHTNVVWIKAGEPMRGWLEFKIDPVWGGLGGTRPADQYIWLDDAHISWDGTLRLGGTTPPSSGQWTLIWSDEFDGTAVDATKWLVEDRDSAGDRAFSFMDGTLAYLPRNVSVVGGNLVLRAMREPSHGRAFTAGAVSTWGKFNVLYGKVEARAKLPGGRGIHSAVWMTTDKPYIGTNDVHNFEVDYAEYVGQWPTIMHHGQLVNPVGDPPPLIGPFAQTDNGTDWSQDFHRYAVEWTPDSLIYSIDDTVRLRVGRTPLHPLLGIPWIPDVPMAHHINIQIVGDDCCADGGWPGPTDATTFAGGPRYLLVDYVRIYHRTPTRTGSIVRPVTRRRVALGRADGVLRWAVNGQEVGHYTNVKCPAGAVYSQIVINPSWGIEGQTPLAADQSIRYADIRVSAP